MIDPNNVPTVADNELLARFILHSNETRSDGTVKPKLFLPYSLVELSVNRHREAASDETWQVGRDVAAARGKTLYGISNIRASSCRIEPLNVVAKPILPEQPKPCRHCRIPTKEGRSDVTSYKARCRDRR